MVAVIVLVTAAAFILPAYVQSRIIPRMAAEFGFSPAEVRVRRIGLWGADLGPIRLDSQVAGVLTLSALQVDYTPWSLVRGRVDGITLAGVGLVLEADTGGISIAGWRPPAVKKTLSPSDKVPDLTTLLPVGLGRVTLLQSHIVIRRGGRSHLIPFEMRLETANLARGVLGGQVRLSVFGNPLTLRAEVDQRANKATVNLACDRFLLESLCRSGLLPEGAAISGVLDVTGDATLKLDPVAVTGLQVTGRLLQTRMGVGRVVLANAADGQGAPQPITFSITAEDPDRIRFAGGPFQLDGPVRATSMSLDGAFIPGRPGWSLESRLDTRIPPQKMDNDLLWEKELPLSWQVRIGPGAADAMNFSLTSAVRRPWAVGQDSLRLAGDSWDIQCHGSFSARELKAETDWTTGPLKMDLPDQGTVQVPGVKVGGTLHWTLSPNTFQVDARALLSQVRATFGRTTATLPRIRFQAEGRADPGRAWAFKGRLTLSDGRVQDKMRRVDARGLGLDLPLQWPAKAKVPGGRLRLNSLKWEGRRLGGIQGTLQQEGRTIRAHLAHRSKLFPGLRVIMNGSLDTGGVRADVRVPPYQPDQGVDLGRFFSAAAGVQAGGRLEARGTAAVTRTGLQGRADLVIDHGFVAQNAQKLKLDGIAMALQIDDIAALKSAPQQKLRVADLQLGDLSAQNLDMDFQIEDRQTLLVEKVGLKWCEGRINAAAVRIVSGKEDYNVTLFCDRLDLAMVLEQLGVAQAGGDGTVNGRIPVRWVNGRLSFDNGFLYSTPGRSGKIQLEGTREILVGIPQGTPQYTQLDIATEALKDYTYQWAKLNVQSKKDILLLKLQLDGKPNRLLPFAYNQESGQFTRVEGEGQAEFKGIGVDMNFNIPLNEIIHYKDLLHRN